MTAQPITQPHVAHHPLEDLYTFRNRADILTFLEAHPGLVPLLEQAQAKLLAYFPDSPLYLEFRPDPEEPECDALALYINANDPHDALLNRLTDEWLLDASDFADGYRLIVDTRSQGTAHR